MCINEHGQDKESGRTGAGSLVEILRLSKGEICGRDPKVAEIAFVCRGMIALSFPGGIGETVDSGKLALFSVGFRVSVTAVCDSYIFICKVVRGIRLCEFMDMEEFDEHTRDIDMEFNILAMNGPVRRYLYSFIPCVEDNLRCSRFLSMKIDELIYLLGAYYTKQEIATFFLPLLRPDNIFRSFVHENMHSCKSLKELAERSNMSYGGFRKRFLRVFGSFPQSYITGAKSERIRYDLLCTGAEIKEISDKYGFSSVPGFTRFCKKHLGETPGSIRSKYKDRWEDGDAWGENDK